MLPTINGKSFLECTESDFKDILYNTSFRENEYIDYKRDYTIDLIPKGTAARDTAVAELRSDVCAFANADGGYLIFGIDEDGEGTPKELCGVEIENPDKWELNFGNRLQSVKPRIPTYKVAFVLLSNGKYVVVLQITHDFFAPYIHLEDEKNYRIYKRVGNSKKTVAYTELKNMFMQSLVLGKEIEQFRRNRVDYYHSQAEDNANRYSQFLLLHIFPETFLDGSYDRLWYALERKDRQISNLFYSFECNHLSQPIVEGLLFSSYTGDQECRLYDNGIAECFYSLQSDLDFYKKHFQGRVYPWRDTWNKIEKQLRDFIHTMQPYMKRKRFFIAVSVIGCKGILSHAANWDMSRKGVIDRNKMLCQPTVLEDISDENKVNLDINRAKLRYLLSLGVMNDDEINPLIKEIYGENQNLTIGALL